MPGFDARHATRRARRSRRAAVVVGVVALATVAVFFVSRDRTPATTPHRRLPAAPAAPRVVTSMAAWRLTAPISRTVVVPWTPAGNQLVIVGGATTGGATASGIFGLDVTRGVLSQVGYLTNTLDDAAGAALDGQVVVFGGTTRSGSASTAVEAITPGLLPSSGTGTVLPESTVLGSLPQPRTAAVAVTVGPTVYLVGGDSGAGPDQSVLSTTDGRNFATAATLPVPVDFPAVAAVGDMLYVFGGTATSGASAGHPVDTIQVVNLTAHTVTATGRLPAPVTGASAVALGGEVLVVGGDTSAAGAAPGTTAPTLSSVTTVWWFDPTSGTAKPVGRLAMAVAHAAVAVLGSTAWVVGGESGGTPVAAVQSLDLAAPPARPATTTGTHRV